jgi:argininosuccinate lyase
MRRQAVREEKNKSAVLWAGRLADKPEDAAFQFQASIKIDRRFAGEDIAGSRAHVAMLACQKIIPVEDAKKIDGELVRVGEEIKNGSLVIDESCEDIHSFIEGVLTARLGEAGRMVHAGRSRNDQVAVDFRLYLKRAVGEIGVALKTTLGGLLESAEKNLETIMPGYTHLQRAQCVTLAHHITAWACALARDIGRFDDALRRFDESPLGSGALATSSLPLDRAATAAALGFARETLNSMDSVSDRDFAVELASACAITQIHLSRFCEDIVIWASEEFKFVDLAESWSTGSSIMPQKKNPDFAELIRGKAGRTTGNLVTLLTILKGLPYAYGKDLQEDKEALFDSFDTVHACLTMFAGLLKTATWNVERMAAACTGGFLDATDAAEYLVQKGLPFRRAHETAALIVRDCLAAGERGIRERPLAELKKRSALFEDDIFERLRPENCVKARKTAGGPAPQEVKRQIDVLRSIIAGKCV